MVERLLAYEDTGVELRDREATTTSARGFEVAGFSWPLLSQGDAALLVQIYAGLILRWQERNLNIDIDAQHRCDFFSSAVLLKASADEIQKEISPETGYERDQIRFSASLTAWEQRLQQLRQLPEGWDSYGASRISDKAIEKGESILTAITAAGFSQQCFVAPCSDGGIQIEFDLPEKELVLEVPPSGEPVTYMLVETTGAGEESETKETIRQREGLGQLLRRISS